MFSGGGVEPQRDTAPKLLLHLVLSSVIHHAAELGKTVKPRFSCSCTMFQPAFVGMLPAFHFFDKLQPSDPLLGLCNLLLHLLVLADEVLHARSFCQAVPCTDGLQLL